MTIPSAERVLLRKEVDWLTHLSAKERATLEVIIEENFARQSPRLDHFTDLYSAPEIAADSETVKAQQKAFLHAPAAEKEGKFYATVLELLIMEFANAWLPGYLFKSSLYDDFNNGVDLILELETGRGRVLRLALDATSSPREAVHKLEIVMNQLNRGKFQTVKYFWSELEEVKGTGNFPKVIVGADRAEITELARLYLKYQSAKNSTIKKGILRQVEEHRLGKELLVTLISQLDLAINILQTRRSFTIEDEEKAKYLIAIRSLVDPGKKTAPAPSTKEADDAESHNSVQTALEEVATRTKKN